MTHKTWTSGTVIDSAWLQDVDNFVYGYTAQSANLVNFLQSGTGGTSRTVQNKLYDIVSVKDYGAVGDGVTDDTTALNNAFAQVGKHVFIPKGTYLFTSNLAAPTCASITGEGELSTTLKASAAVTRAFDYDGVTNYPRRVTNFLIDGTATSGATGLFFGRTTSLACSMDRVQVKNFAGTNGVGIRVCSMLKSLITGCTTYGCTDGLYVYDNLADGNPTTIHFDSCVFTNSGRYGARIAGGTGLLFTNCDFESSTNEGVFVDTSLGTDIIHVVFDNCWFEQNNTAVGSNGYHFNATSNGGTRTVRVSIKHCVFSIGTHVPQGAQRAIILSGQDIRGYQVVFPALSIERNAETITIASNASGRIDEWPSWLNYGDNVNTTGAFDFGVWGASNTVRYWTAAPTVASANTITIANVPVTFVSGTTVIKTINVPTTWVGTANYGGRITIIPTGAFTWDTTGNIAVAGTAVVSRALDFIFDKGTGKWYPSYV